MNLDFSLLDKTIREDLKEVLDILFDNDFFVTLVGGGTRDFFLSSGITSDLDFELRNNNSFSGDVWGAEIEKLITLLESKFDVERLPFNIFRIDFEKYSLEFSSPRVETFKNDSQLGHSDFSIEICSDFRYETAFSRRDFTINAIGLEIKKEGTSVIDPFKGMNDLEDGILKACSDDLYKDPVRFLRLIRFSQKLNFKISNSIVDSFSKFDLSKVSGFYFFKEGLKVDLLSFSKKIFKIIEKEKIQLNPALLPLKVFNKDTSQRINSKDALLNYLANEVNNSCLSKEVALDICRLAQIKLKAFKGLIK